MNPFTVGQTLTVVFGTRQRWCVERVTPTHCAMRYPGLTCAAVKWFRVADLRAWNPQPCRALALTFIPVQFPAIVPGLRIQRTWHDPIATYPSREDFTVVCVMRGYAFVRHNDPHHLAGSILSRPLRTFWYDRHNSTLRIGYEPVSLSGAELRNIAEQWRDLVRTGNPLTTIWRRFNSGMDKLTPDQWDTLQAGWEYHRTERLLRADLRKVAGL